MLSVGFGLKKFKNSMKYSVFFIQDEKDVELVEGLSDVQACQYAINLHQSSNLPHVIKVATNPDHDVNVNYVCLLTLKK